MAKTRYAFALHRDTAALAGLPFGGPLSTPFQSRVWLETWYAAFCAAPDHKPLIALGYQVTDRAAPGDPPPERLALALPLVRRRVRGLTTVEWADRGVSDYNLPILSPAFDGDADAWLAALSRAVRPYARLALRKMPLGVRGRPNPLAASELARPDALDAHHLSLAGGVEALEARLGRKKRRDLRRAIRLLSETGNTPVFRFAENAAEREAVFALVRRSQTARYGPSGAYLLDAPAHADFYDRLVGGAGTRHLVRLAALWLGETPVAGLVALIGDSHCIVVRLGMSDDPAIAKAGPGKLLTFEMAAWAARNGFAVLDLSIGASQMKTWFGCEPQPLVRVTRYANGYL